MKYLYFIFSLLLSLVLEKLFEKVINKVTRVHSILFISCNNDKQKDKDKDLLRQAVDERISYGIPQRI